MFECKSFIIYELPATILSYPVTLFSCSLKQGLHEQNVIILLEFVRFLVFQKFIMAMELM